MLVRCASPATLLRISEGVSVRRMCCTAHCHKSPGLHQKHPFMAHPAWFQDCIVGCKADPGTRWQCRDIAAIGLWQCLRVKSRSAGPSRTAGTGRVATEEKELCHVGVQDHCGKGLWSRRSVRDDGCNTPLGQHPKCVLRMPCMRWRRYGLGACEVGDDGLAR